MSTEDTRPGIPAPLDDGECERLAALIRERVAEADAEGTARAAPDRVREDAATARTLLSGALLGELSRRVLDYENAITWNTSCTSCARVLDSAAAERERAERAGAKLAAIAEHRNAACAALRIAETQARYPAGDEATAERYRAAREALEGSGEKGPGRG